jgi:hypothetical protein
MINQMWVVVKNMLDKNARDRTSLYTKGDSLTVRLYRVAKLYAFC